MATLIGLEFELPNDVVTNEALAGILGCPESEVGWAGPTSRRHAALGQGPSDLAATAANRALGRVGRTVEDVDLILFATMTPDFTFPGSGCFLQDKLGGPTIGALDVRAQCAGFLFGLDIASQFLRAGMYRRILLAAGEVHSAGLDFSKAGARITPLFGDGAAVALIDAEGAGIVETVVHTDGRDFARFWCETPASRRPPVRVTPEDLETKSHYPVVDFEAVAADGEAQIHAAIEEVLERASVPAADVARFVVHHILPSAARKAVDRLGVTERTTFGEPEVAHVASASLPIALRHAINRGEAKAGDLVCLATAGSGRNWGAALLRLGEGLA